MVMTNEEYWRSTFTDEMKEKDLVILGMGETFILPSNDPGYTFPGWIGINRYGNITWLQHSYWIGDAPNYVYVVERDSEIARMNGFAALNSEVKPRDDRKFVVTIHRSAGNDTVGEMWRETKIFDADTTLGEMMNWKPTEADHYDRIVTLAQ